MFYDKKSRSTYKQVVQNILLQHLDICQLFFFLPVPHRKHVVVWVIHGAQATSSILKQNMENINASPNQHKKYTYTFKIIKYCCVSENIYTYLHFNCYTFSYPIISTKHNNL